MMKNSMIILLITILFSACNFDEKHLETPIIPRPDGIYPVPSSFSLNESSTILIENESEEMINLAQKLKSLIDTIGNLNIEIQNLSEAKGLSNTILLSSTNTTDRLKDGGYRIEVDKDKVVIQGQEFDGLFNGVMSLHQMILLHHVMDSTETIEIPNVQMWDDPAFGYRGMHLDVGRHFFPVTFIKKYLDIMALYKFNYYHWHLTEDQGWRIEIKAYPELTEIGAYRKEADGSIYGGYYTQDEIKEVVAYAKSLNIAVIPEIEMPGHSEAALACYPQLSCSGEPRETPSLWGVFENVYCAGNEETFEFLENVLDEVMELFPGEYIHIGGDECPKTNWKKCPKCQKRIEEEGLKDEHELQSYFIKRIEKYLSSHGRKLIGWDEILEGGLPPEATVMSWRGMQGGIDAAKEEHQVIMTPTDYCYFDYYQADPEFEPKAIGGYLPLTKVYAFNPVPKELNEEQQAYVIGGQANVWTEYMETTDYVEYMLLPRMLALSEALWSNERNKNFKDFNKRLQTHKKLLTKLGYNYSNGSYKLAVETHYDTVSNENKISFTSEQYEPEIRYVINDIMILDSGNIYKNAFAIDTSGTITAGIFEEGKLVRKATKVHYVNHLGIGLDLKLLKKSSWRYGAETGASLLDGIQGSDNYKDGHWAGFQGKDLIAEIDFSKPTDVNQLRFNYINHDGAWILPPKSVSIYVREQDEGYHLLLEQDFNNLMDESNHQKGEVTLAFDGNQIVALKVIIENYKVLPVSHSYAGEDCWLFVDELVIE